MEDAIQELDSLVEDDSQLIVELTEDDKRRIACPPGVNEHQREKLRKDAKKNWDLFYKRNGDRFFKKRYWTRREFSELFRRDDGKTEVRYLLEVGCGCGDFALPLLDNQPDKADGLPQMADSITLPNDLYIYCCDISDVAIGILSSNSIYKKFESTRIKAFVGNVLDIESVQPKLDDHKMDFISLIFVLSALEVGKMNTALATIAKLIKPGGLVFFRDYAIYDKAMLRFNERSKVHERLYVRQDGTMAYFFEKSEIVRMFKEAGFQCASIAYVKRDTVNNATQSRLSRLFLQAKFIKAS